jgi:hypothetical protein
MAPNKDREKHKGLEMEWSEKPTSQRNHQHSAKIRKSTKAESGGAVTGQLPKQGKK